MTGSKTLTAGSSATFGSDRLSRISQSLSLANGFVTAPSSTYFTSGDHSIMLWIYPRAFKAYAPILDFGNNQNDDIWLGFSGGSPDGKINYWLYKGGTTVLTLASSSALVVNTWQHVAVTFKSSTKQANIYVNAVSKGSGVASNTPNNVARSRNYIGQDSWAAGPVNAMFDEIKIFSVTLTQSEIQVGFFLN